MRFRDQLLENGGVENLAADRHPFPHVVEQLAINRCADLGTSLLQRGMRVGEQLVVRGELVEAEILHPDHAELLEVRIRVPPAASLIEPDAVGQHLPERSLRLLQVEAAQRGLEQPFGADLRIRPIEAERVLRGGAQRIAPKPRRSRILQRAEEARADEAHEEEVVEVAGLERGVLAVVGEAEELSRVAVQPRPGGAVHPAQYAADEYGGRRAAALRRERGEAGAVARRPALRVAATEAEAEPAGQEPQRRPRTDAPVGRDHEAPGARVAVVGLDPRVAGGGQLDPGLRIVLVAAGEAEVGIVGRARRQEAELPFGMRSGRVLAGLVPPSGWRVVDVAREEDGTPFLLHQPHRVILVAALTTEVHGVQALVRVAGEKLLAIDRHCARARRLDRRIGVAGARDELVELEGEEARLARAGVRRADPLGDARCEKKVSQHLAAGSGGPTGLRRERVHRLGHRPGPGPDPALVGFGERDPETGLHPHRERVLPERRVGEVRRDGYAGIDGLAEARSYRVGGSGRNGDAIERLGDDVALGDPASEELRSHVRDHAVLVHERSLARHRGRGADAQERPGLEPLADPAHQQRHVRTLAAAVRVQFVQNQEAQARAVADDPAVDLLLPRHEELEHHEVGEQDVRRVVRDLPPLAGVFLPRVAGERDRPVSRRLLDELAELLHLGVRERVHRVDDDGARAPLGARAPCAQNVVDDGDEEAERLPGARAGRHHEALTFRGERNGLLLVLVEGQRPAVRAEDVGAAGIDDTGRHQGTEVRRAFVARVDLDERFGPVAVPGVDGLDLLADVRSADRREGRCEALVLVDDAVAEGEHVQRRCASRPGDARTRWVARHHRLLRIPRESAGLEIR